MSLNRRQLLYPRASLGKCDYPAPTAAMYRSKARRGNTSCGTLLIKWCQIQWPFSSQPAAVSAARCSRGVFQQLSDPQDTADLSSCPHLPSSRAPSLASLRRSREDSGNTAALTSIKDRERAIKSLTHAALCAFLCDGAGRAARQRCEKPDGEKELCSGGVTAKASELPWWGWGCHQTMCARTSGRREPLHSSIQEIKAELENKSIWNNVLLWGW